MADAATENRVLPEYHHLIVDEAHHLENAVTDQLSFKADSLLVSQTLAAVHPHGGRAAQGTTPRLGAAGRHRRNDPPAPRRRPSSAAPLRGTPHPAHPGRTADGVYLPAG